MASLLDTLSPMARNYVKPDAPGAMKMMAASGRVPLPPRDLVMILYILGQDSDDRLAAEAQRSFKAQPINVLRPLMQASNTPKELLDFCAKMFSENANLLSTILLNRTTGNETFVWLATRVQGNTLQLIAQNQQRQLEEPRLVQSLLKNNDLNTAERSRIIEFALREDIETGLSVEDLIPYALDSALDEDDFLDGLLDEASVEQVSKEEVAELLDVETVKTEEEKKAQEQQATASISMDAMPQGQPEEWKETAEDWEDRQKKEAELAEPVEEKRLSLEQQVLTWTIPQKIKAALMGNKQLRTLLIRDSNRLVCSAVMRNPGMNDSEVIKIASNPAMSEDVMREITRNRQWMKSYSLKLALVNNPKTPMGTALRLVNEIRHSDLKHLMKNKNVSNTISTAARRLYKRKQK